MSELQNVNVPNEVYFNVNIHFGKKIKPAKHGSGDSLFWALGEVAAIPVIAAYKG